MAETTIQHTEQLVLGVEFTDEDTRTITQDNPKSDISQSDLTAFETAASGVLIGDQRGAAFSRLKSAIRRNTTRTEMTFA